MALKKESLLPELRVEEGQYLFVLGALSKLFRNGELISWDAYRRRDINIKDNKRLGSSIVVLCTLINVEGREITDRLELKNNEEFIAADFAAEKPVRDIISAFVEESPEVCRLINVQNIV